MWFFSSVSFFLRNISFAQAHGAGEQQARSKDFGGSGDRIRKVEGKRWTDKGWTVKRNELLPCRRRSVTDSSVFISFWHDSLVSSSLIVSFDSCQYSISSTRVSRFSKQSSREWKENAKETAQGCARVKGQNLFNHMRVILSKNRLLMNISRYVSL